MTKNTNTIKIGLESQIFITAGHRPAEKTDTVNTARSGRTIACLCSAASGRRRELETISVSCATLAYGYKDYAFDSASLCRTLFQAW